MEKEKTITIAKAILKKNKVGRLTGFKTQYKTTVIKDRMALVKEQTQINATKQSIFPLSK